MNLVKLMEEICYYTSVLQQQLLLLVYENKIMVTYSAIVVNDQNTSLHHWISIICYNFSLFSALLQSCMILKGSNSNSTIVREEIQSIKTYFGHLQIIFQDITDEFFFSKNLKYRYENEIVFTFIHLESLIQNFEIISPILNNVTPPTPPGNVLTTNENIKEDPFLRLEDSRNATPSIDANQGHLNEH